MGRSLELFLSSSSNIDLELKRFCSSNLGLFYVPLGPRFSKLCQSILRWAKFCPGPTGSGTVSRTFLVKDTRTSSITFFLSDDNLQPITVSNEDEEETFSSFSFAQIILKSQSKFPKTLPFSKSVLVIHQLLQKYIASGKFTHTPTSLGLIRAPQTVQVMSYQGLTDSPRNFIFSIWFLFGFLADVTCRDYGGIESKCGEFITKKSSNNNGTKYKSRKCKRFDLDTNITICHESELHGKVCPRRRNEHKKSFNRNVDLFRAPWTVGRSLDGGTVLSVIFN